MPKLTKTAVDNASAGDKETWIWCAELPGFGVRVQPSGRKTYVARYRNQAHQQRKYTIGRCCDLTPDQARALARKVFAEVADGHDPAAGKSALRSAPTMADLRDRYLTEHAKPFKKQTSAKQDEDNWRRNITPLLGDSTRVADVTRADVLKMVGKMVDRPAAANQCIALLSKAMNLAELWGWRKDMNPCRHVKKLRLREHDTILSADQIRTLTATMDDMVDHQEIPSSMADLVKLLMLTGCRLNEIMSARQEWVDRDLKVLRLPDSKVGQRVIPLPTAAMEIIEAIPAGEWLIPGRIAKEHLKQPHGMWSRIRVRARLPAGIRPHDLRHNYGSLGHRLGASLRQVAGVLGHSNLSTTERYTHAAATETSRTAEMIAAEIARSMSA